MIKRAVTGVKATFVILDMQRPCFLDLPTTKRPAHLPAHTDCVCVFVSLCHCVCKSVLEADFSGGDRRLHHHTPCQHHVMNDWQVHSSSVEKLCICAAWCKEPEHELSQMKTHTPGRVDASLSVLWESWRHTHLLLWLLICISSSSSLSLQCHDVVSAWHKLQGSFDLFNHTSATAHVTVLWTVFIIWAALV